MALIQFQCVLRNTNDTTGKLRTVGVQILSRATVPKDRCNEGTKEGIRNDKIERPGEIRGFLPRTCV